MKVRTAAVALVLAMAYLPTPALAQEQVGVRVGVSADPDQFVFGGHADTPPLLERLIFRPNIEIGIGDDLIVIALNFEFAYKIALDNRSWTPYLGAGPAVNIFDRNDDGRRRGGDDTNVEGGFNILLGAEHTGGLFTELKVGALDSPDLKFLVGFSF